MLLRPNMSNRVEAFLGAGLQKVDAVGLVLAGLSLPLPLFLNLGNSTYLGIAVAGATLALLLSLGQPHCERKTFMRLFLWAFWLRFSALGVVSFLLPYAGRAFLNPDAQAYYEVSKTLASGSSWVDLRPDNVLGTWDVGHYYLFALAIRALNADLFALKAMNVVFGSLSCSLLYALARRTVPERALSVAALTTVFPSMIWLAASDLLKDPSVMLATIAVALSASAILHSGVKAQLWYAVLGALALIYLRFTRGYVAAFLELSAVVLALWALARDRRVFSAPHVGRTAAVCFLALLAADTIPAALGQPPSVPLLVEQVRHVTVTPQMRDQPQGLVESRLPTALPTPGSGDRETGDEEAWGAGMEGGTWIARRAVGLVRSLFGPFAWVLPDQWTLQQILLEDFPLYPGMLLWYLFLPFVVVGLVTQCYRLCAGQLTETGLAYLSVFLLLYLAVYLSTNLSYRQRDVVFPLLFIFGFIGASRVPEGRLWRLAYSGYCGALLLLAVLHTLIRSQ